MGGGGAPPQLLVAAPLAGTGRREKGDGLGPRRKGGYC